MGKIVKGIGAMSLTTLVAMSAMFGATACSSKEASARVQVDINPSIEFTVDSANKVVTVTALNEDGNILLSSENFRGMSIDDAVEKVVDIAYELGYAQSVNDQISLAVQGEKASELLTSIKEEVGGYFAEHNIQGIILDAKSNSLKQLALACGYTEAECNGKTDAELVAMISSVRSEMQGYFSEELKDLYISAKNYEFDLASQKATQEAISKADENVKKFAEKFNEPIAKLDKAIQDINDLRHQKLIQSDSDYQVALRKVQEAKADVLAKKTEMYALDKNTPEYIAANAILGTLEGLLTASENALNMLKVSIESTLDFSAKSVKACQDAIKITQTSLLALSGDLKELLNSKVKEIDSAANKAKDAFFAKFEKTYNKDIATLKQNAEAQKKALKDKIDALRSEAND